MLHWYKTRLSVRLMVWSSLIALIPLFLVALLSYHLFHNSLVELELAKIAREIHWIDKSLQTHLYQFPSDILSLSRVPPIEGLIRTRQASNNALETNTDYKQWREQLSRIFATFLQNKPFYFQLRYLDETGQEIVRVDRKGDHVIVVPEEQLQDKSKRSYFIKTKTVPHGMVYISPLNLNRERGQVEVPHVPVIRFSTPVYDADQHFRGIVISNYRFDLKDNLEFHQGHFYLVNQDGYYLLHPNPQHTFGFDLGHEQRVQTDYPSVWAGLKSIGQKTYVGYNQDKTEVLAARKIHFDPFRPNRYWVLLRTLPTSVVLRTVNYLRYLMLGVGLVVAISVLLLARVLAQHFTKPINNLKCATTQIAETDMPAFVSALQQVAAGQLNTQVTLQSEHVKLTRHDEIGELEQSFNIMTTRLHQASYVFEQMTKRLQSVITDIVTVSDGLAQGQLDVKPQAEYQGDFVQINTALTTSLTAQRQVIEDIVHVSQSLAQGALSVQPQADYRGSFQQIKQALQTAAKQLAAAKAKNERESWLKIGQAQLNEKLSGEQDVVNLARAVINFLASYLSLPIGALYLLEDAQGQPVAHLVASYAYYQRKGLPHQFAIGEGIIGQVILEKQLILISNVPDDYILIQSGNLQHPPRHIIALPFLYEDEVKGVIELGSLSQFNELQQEFLQLVMGNVAIAIHTAQARKQVNRLLQQR